jgi:hypothetical protein
MSFYTNMRSYLANVQALNPAIILDMCRLDEEADALPTLTDPATAGDIMKDKQVVDAHGDLLTGTKEPLPTLTRAATAADIMSGLEVLDGSGEVLVGTRDLYDLSITTVVPEGATYNFILPQCVKSNVETKIVMFAAVLAEGFHYEAELSSGDGENIITYLTTATPFTYGDGVIAGGGGLIISTNVLNGTQPALTLTITIAANEQDG